MSVAVNPGSTTTYIAVHYKKDSFLYKVNRDADMLPCVQLGGVVQVIPHSIFAAKELKGVSVQGIWNVKGKQNGETDVNPYLV